MSDPIDRQSAIDAFYQYPNVNWTTLDVMEKINELPSVQPEIIRCKDCKHRDAENGLCEGRGWPMQLVSDDGFCDKGERSEE